MNSFLRSFIFTIILTSSLLGFSQESHQTNPIPDFGFTFEVPNPDFETDTTSELKVVFDITSKSKDENEVNGFIESAARFINMNVKAGVPAKNIKVAMVFHSTAINDILNNDAYLKRNPKSINGNPNTKLITELSNFGTQIIVCGQTAAAAHISKNEFLPEVKVALSAMNALVQLQNEDYQLIKF
mgnify:CR=1 FL=1